MPLRRQPQAREERRLRAVSPSGYNGLKARPKSAPATPLIKANDEGAGNTRLEPFPNRMGQPENEKGGVDEKVAQVLSDTNTAR